MVCKGSFRGTFLWVLEQSWPRCHSPKLPAPGQLGFKLGSGASQWEGSTATGGKSRPQAEG